MGVFNKIMNILFDEQETEEEIPVITKSKKKEEPTEKEKTRRVSSESIDDEVIVNKIEKNPNEDENLFDMPKASDESIVEDKAPTRTFTFPIFDDDEDDELPTEIPKRSKREEKEEKIDKDKPSRAAYDYLSSTSFKYKTDDKADAYTRSRNNIYDKDNLGKKPFTPSPVISPVYGILNENYKKEDIIEKDSSANRIQKEKVDFDSVRRKAYGTLEDEIEVTLGKSSTDDLLDEVPTVNNMSIDTLSDEGLSISDLLVDDELPMASKDIKEDSNTSIIDDDDIEEVNVVEKSEFDDEVLSKDNEKEVIIDSEENSDDLFDLIDSIYAGKDEE